jgi:uncharacterized protein involved in exopolysaccharide biosynthesis
MRESFRSQAQEKRKFIEERIAEVSIDLEKSENSLATFRERNMTTFAPKVFLEEQRLLRNQAMNQEIYIQLKKQYELARIEEKNDQPLIEVLQKPEIPIIRASPQRTKIVVLATMLGFVFSIFGAFVWQWYCKNIKTN